ncbi:ABC transporter ATP-binding protein [Bauldia sp.]|uniref:ABC transporter ATP-binding protein n=1 Tax=Bauldia sp. TaxID=2575872 RepID=UPI003BA900FC
MGRLNLIDVTKSFGAVEVIKGVSLDVEHGAFVVFVGPSGCGKSTLLRMIAGLEEITSGEARIDDRVVNDLPPVKRGIAMVFQSYALYPHMSVFENIAFPLRVERRPENEIKERVGRASAILQLDERLKYRPGQLSGGQRQRVAIGRAIVREPSVFLFDEPLSNLDAALRAEMRVELAKLHNSLDATMVYVTHDQVEAMTMADRIVVLDAGLISQAGTPLELYHKPQNLFVAGFIGNPRMNFIHVTGKASSVDGVTVTLPNGADLTLPVEPRGDVTGQTLTLGIRPEDIRTSGGDVSLAATPTVIERLGIHTVAYANIEGSDNIFCSLLAGVTSAEVGKPIDLTIAAADCHLFDSNGQAFERRVAMSAIDPTLLAHSGKA